MEKNLLVIVATVTELAVRFILRLETKLNYPLNPIIAESVLTDKLLPPYP